MIYEINHIWTAEMKWRWRNDRRSERNLCNCVKKPEKKISTSTGFEPVTSRYRSNALPIEVWSHWRWEQVNCGFICSREPHEKIFECLYVIFFPHLLAVLIFLFCYICWCFSEMNRRQHEGVVMSRSAYLTHRPTRTGRNLWSARIHTLLETGHSWIPAQHSSKCPGAWENLSWDTYGCCFFFDSELDELSLNEVGK